MKFYSRADQSHTLYQRLATTATLIIWGLAQSRGDEHRSLVTPERVLSEYNEDLIIFVSLHFMEFQTLISLKIFPIFITLIIMLMTLLILA